MNKNTNQRSKGRNPTGTARKTPKNNNNKQEVNHSNEPDDVQQPVPQQITQEMFEERWEVFMGQLQEAVDKEGALVALAVVVDPKLGFQPMVLAKGPVYEQAKVAAMLYRRCRSVIEEELSIGPGPQTNQGRQ